MAKFFRTPFAAGGDRTAIPEAEQGDGSVSYTEGFGPDYELAPSIEGSKDVPRNQTNELHYEEQLAIRQYQTEGTPDFITSADNDGDPYPYGKGARVRYDDGDGFKIYQSLVDNNEALPTDTTKWVWLDPDTQISALIFPNAVFEGSVANNNAVYWNSGTNQFTKAIADGTIAQNVIGIADVTGKRVFMAGLNSLFTGLTPGATYYLSDTVAGQITVTPPPNNIIHVATAIESTQLIINIVPAAAIASAIPVGMSIDYNGFDIPAGFLPEDGSAISRTTYALLFSKITSLQPGAIVNGSAIVTGLTSTANFRPEMDVTGSGIPLGTNIQSVDSATQVTLSANATATGTIPIRFYLHGAGDESTTFNVPDSRRRVTVGAGGDETSVLGNTTGAVGGEEAHTMLLTELVPHHHSFTSYTTADGDNAPRSAQAPDEPHVNDTTDTGGGAAFNIMQPSLIVTRLIKY